MSRQIKSKDNLAYYTATLGFVEVSLGGALHYFKVPFSGHFLNLNQIYFMNRLSFEEKRKTAGIELSIMTAILKSLGPIGKKITPMIAISLQGLLYTIGVSLLGTNLLGQVLGSVLSAVWPMIQSVTAYYLLYGEDFFKLIKMTVLKLYRSSNRVIYISTHYFNFIKNSSYSHLSWFFQIEFIAA